MRPKTSSIWIFYEEIDDLKARCKVCDQLYSRKGRTTTALKSHLKAKHAEAYEEFQKLDEAVKLSSETIERKATPIKKKWKYDENETTITVKDNDDSDEDGWPSKRVRTPSFEYIGTEQSGVVQDTQYVLETSDGEEIIVNKNDLLSQTKHSSNVNKSLLDLKKDILIQELEHNKIKHELEIQHLKKKQSMEIQFLTAKNKLEIEVLKKKIDSINSCDN